MSVVAPAPIERRRDRVVYVAAAGLICKIGARFMEDDMSLKSRSWALGIISFGALTLALAACGRDEADVTSGQQGVTKDKILVGASMPFSGPLAVFGLYSKGVEAHINYVNDSGGVPGRKSEYKAYDDGYEPSARHTISASANT
jgi:ABC-type branched-subunit amino acid transport system substrate-binding protein